MEDMLIAELKELDVKRRYYMMEDADSDKNGYADDEVYHDWLHSYVLRRGWEAENDYAFELEMHELEEELRRK